ncbi:hypothetical protein BH11BAC4_BH11BAC4_16700 [soil metagenome]
MKKTLIFLLCSLLIGSFQKAIAQYDFQNDLYYSKDFVYEVGASVGMMNCFTDLGGTKGVGKSFIKDRNLGNSQVSAGVYVSLMYKYAVALRLEITLGHVKASDNSLESVKETTSGRYERNLSFKSKINEVALIAEIHPLYFRRFRDGARLPRLSPYLMGGIGFFKFKPQAKLNDKWVNLQPLSTEGQGFSEYPDRSPYKLTQLVIPVGFGVKYKISPLLNLSLECASRILFTDYLDDVSTNYIDPTVYSNHFSGEQLANALLLNDRQKELNPNHSSTIGWQRGNPANNDSYFTFNIKIAALL